MGHDATPVGSGSAASRAELVAAWREHRRERRHHLTANGAPTDGFLVRKWRQAGVYGAESLALVTALLEQLLDLPEDESPALVQAADVLREALRGEPSSGVVDAVRILLEDASPAEVADALLVVHDARLLWLSPRGSRWLEFLTSCDNELLPDELMPDQHDDPSAAFALLQALRSSAVADLSKSDTERLLPWVPESIADDFITLGLVTAAQVPWRVRADDPEFRRVYWRARLVPASITREEAEALDWTAAVLRQDFLDGKQPHMEPGSVYDLLERACGGDTSVLKDLEEFLPRPLVLRLRQVTDGAATGNWEPDIVGDRALWRLMATLWAPRAAIDPHRGAFYEIRGLNHAYDLILRRQFKHAATQLRKVAASEHGTPKLRDEAWNMLAYLALLDEDLDQALGALAQVGYDTQAAANADLIHRRRGVVRNLRPHAANPYLELGLPHAFEGDWKAEYRRLRQEHAEDAWEAARLNRAMKGIEQVEQADDWCGLFVLPLNPSALEYPQLPPVSLVPPLEQLSRRTPATGDADLRAVRNRALPSLLPAFLSTPRRPDHQHGTPS